MSRRAVGLVFDVLLYIVSLPSFYNVYPWPKWLFVLQYVQYIHSSNLKGSKPVRNKC